MRLDELKTSSGHFTIAAFDQRGSLAKLLGVDPARQSGHEELSQLKTQFMETFSPICSAVLVDMDFGKESLRKRDPRAGLLLTLEDYDYASEQREALPLFKNDWGVPHIAERQAAVKLLLYYHPESKTAEEKVRIVQDLHAQCKEWNVPFLLEPVLYPLNSDEAFVQRFFDLQLQMAKTFDPMCDVLKLEFPVPAEQEIDAPEVGRRCIRLTESLHVPWIILSRGMTYERYIRALEIALKNGASGFAVGRAVWKEVGNLPTWEERKQFIQTVGRERMLRLIELVETA